MTNKNINTQIQMMMSHINFSGGHDWKRICSAGNKQILPQRVAKFVTPLGEIADDLIEQLEKCRDEDGNINDIREFITKWSLQGTCNLHHVMCVIISLSLSLSPSLSLSFSPPPLPSLSLSLFLSLSLCLLFSCPLQVYPTLCMVKK